MTVNELIAALERLRETHGNSLLYVDARMTNYAGSDEVPFTRVGVELELVDIDADGSPVLHGKVTLTD